MIGAVGLFGELVDPIEVRDEVGHDRRIEGGEGFGDVELGEGH